VTCSFVDRSVQLASIHLDKSLKRTKLIIKSEKMDKNHIQRWHKEHPIISAIVATIVFLVIFGILLFLVLLPGTEERGGKILAMIIAALVCFFVSYIFYSRKR
jgi:drug/metabolite transporter (DMT)-like permease